MGTREAALKNLEKRKSKGGRPAGCRNKFTTLKESFLKAYEHKDGFGGDETKNSSQRIAAMEYLMGFILFPMGPSDLMYGERVRVQKPVVWNMANLYQYSK
jgi:hypothetical protein